MIGCLPTQALAFLAVFVYARNASDCVWMEIGLNCVSSGTVNSTQNHCPLSWVFVWPLQPSAINNNRSEVIGRAASHNTNVNTGSLNDRLMYSSYLLTLTLLALNYLSTWMKHVKIVITNLSVYKSLHELKQMQFCPVFRCFSLFFCKLVYCLLQWLNDQYDCAIYLILLWFI